MFEDKGRSLGSCLLILAGIGVLGLDACSVTGSSRGAPASSEVTDEPTTVVAEPIEPRAMSLELAAPAPAALPGGVLPRGAFKEMDRPAFTGEAAKKSCPSGMSRNHLISWESIRSQYAAALNPSPPDTCVNNLELLYESVGLPPDPGATSAACAPGNVSTDAVTDADRIVLSNLNSSIDNLRCSHDGANKSVGGALDVPCSNQRYNNSNSRIEITGITADRLSKFLAIRSTLPPFLYFYQTNRPCGGSGACSDIHLQSSDCSDDVGAKEMPESNEPVVYWASSGSWQALSR